MTPAVRYTPNIETIEPDETETQSGLAETFRAIIRTMHDDHGHAYRGVHAKSHALLQGRLHVLNSLPAEYAQGLFAHPRDYDVLLRISTGSGDLLPDSVSLLRGIGIKILGVEGERLEGSEDDDTQDFLLANGTAFPTPGPKKFLQNLRLLAPTTDKAEGLKKTLSAVFRTVEKGVEALGGESPTLEQMGGHRHSHPLGDRYFSQAPIRYGDHIAKVGLVPLSPNFKALEGQEIDIAGRNNALREDIGELLAREAGEWELRVQLCRDLDRNPIEDASIPWPEEDNPYVAVAVIRVEPQFNWSWDRAAVLDDRTSFNPWHGLAAHRPLGAVMRARKVAYAASVDLRGRLNGCPIHEPSNADLPA